jgi:hypothetical protein
VDWTQTWTFIGAVTGVIALQSFWLNRVLVMFKDSVDRRFDDVDRRFDDVDRRFEQVDRRFDRIESRLDRIEHGVVREHGERITRLEERRG